MKTEARGGSAPPIFIERTILFTDIEGSTERWDTEPSTMRALLADHNDVLEAVIAQHHGTLVNFTGDGVVAAFERTSDALDTALEVQAALVDGPSRVQVSTTPLSLRMGLHRGVVERRDSDLLGPVMHRCARIMSAGHGGQILLSALVAADVRAHPPSGVRLVERGTHRLKGFHEPELLVEVAFLGAKEDPRLLRTENVNEGWLPPADEATFIGREGEVAAIAEMLAPGRLVTIVGTGGIGKTRLATHVGMAARAAFPHGAWFVDLAGLQHSDRVLPAICDSLGLSDDSSAPPADLLRRALATRRSLLILDNCEHVLDAVSSTLRAVFAPDSSATVVCTSQRDLGVSGERVVPLAPLDVGHAPRWPPAVQLFVQRAHAANPDFRPDDTQMEIVAQICQRLEGLPLAIELAAARVRVMSLAALAERLATTFDVLRSRDRPERHQTLTAAISWSIDLLGADDRAVLLDLSVFNGDFDWEGAAAVSGKDDIDVADALDELVRRSLLVRTGQRFRLLVPLRLFCRTRVREAGRWPEVEERHARYVRSTVVEPIDGPDATAVARRLEHLVDHIDDLQATHEWLLANDPVEAARFSLDLVELWVARGRGHEAMAWLAASDTDDVPAPLRAEVLGWIAAFGWTAGRNEEGEVAARRALAIAHAAGLPLPAFAATRLAVRLAFSNRTEEALQLAREAEDALRAGHGDVARVLGALAVVMAVGGDTPHAIELADEAVASARARGVLRLLGALSNRMLVTPGEPVIETLSSEAAEIAWAVGRMSVVAHTALAMAHRRRREGDIRAFLRGVAEFCDLMIDAEPTATVGTLRLVPEAVVATAPREAAVLHGAVEVLAERYDHLGTDVERQAQARTAHELRVVLGDQGFENALNEGRAMSLAEAVDVLRWLTGQVAVS